MIAVDVDTSGLERLSARIGGLLALACCETDHEEDARWWLAHLHPHAVAASEGRKSKHLGLYALREEKLGVGTPAGQARLRALRYYTWRTSPTARMRGGRVYRTVSLRSPASSWWYPPKTWVRHRRWRTKQGIRERVTTHAIPARDLKPSLLRGRKYVVVPIRSSGPARYVPSPSRRTGGARRRGR